MDIIPTADLRKKRSRKWDQVHRLETVTYRGIPRHVVELIIEESQSLSVHRDEVVRVFLEYGVRLYPMDGRTIDVLCLQGVLNEAEDPEGVSKVPAEIRRMHTLLVVDNFSGHSLFGELS